MLVYQHAVVGPSLEVYDVPIWWAEVEELLVNVVVAQTFPRPGVRFLVMISRAWVDWPPASGATVHKRAAFDGWRMPLQPHG